ncbi:MAG: DHH family phosphoesterase [Candidatus Omnitrophica bacterium]|nr:DHH family phosphoesterase [Candidatus Omnitrophota bacterium]
MISRSRWQLFPADPVAASRLAHTCHLPPLIGQFLLNRGIGDPQEVERFFSPDGSALRDPLELSGMREAVTTVRQAVASRSPIMVFGDSDVDGMTASAIVFDVLTSLGAATTVRIANRLAHGYGFPSSLIREVVRLKVKVVLLVDCGTNQAEEIRRLAAHRVKTVILDHHLPTDHLARPSALINPHCADARGLPQTASFGAPIAHPADGWVPGLGRELCSAGLAFKFAQAMWGKGDERLASLMELAAIGTLADYVPLLGENRILVNLGLRRLLHSSRPGLRLLCEALQLTRATPEQVLGRLTPCLNAAGRLGQAMAVWRVLVESSVRRAKSLIRTIGQIYQTSKVLHRRMLSEANEQASRLHFKDHAVVMVGRRGWHPGFMGPVAAQLADRFGRPAIAIAMDETAAVGSGRSMGMCNLFEALRACEGTLLRYGGHARACGLTLAPENLERLREQLNRYMQTTGSRAQNGRRLAIDAQASLQEMTREVACAMERFAPFGPENERPLVMIRQVRLEEDASRVSWLTDGQTTRKIWGRRLALSPDEWYDLVGSPRLVTGDVAMSLCEARLTRLSERVPV